MKIGIDITQLQKWNNRFRGIGCYIYNLVENIIAQDSENEYVLFMIKGEKDENVISWIDSLSAESKAKALEVVEVESMEAISIKDSYVLNKIVSKKRIDVMHFPIQGSVPIFRSYKSVVTVHDVAQLRFPEMYLKNVGFRYKMRFLFELKITSKSEKIISISQNTKKDIIKYLKVQDKRIEIIYNGINKEMKPIENNELIGNLKGRLNIGGNFLLYVGGINKRKNILRVLESFNRIVEDRPDDVCLVVVGKTDPNVRKFIKDNDAEKFMKNVIFSGYVTDDELVALYNGCEYLVFPSIYEGFGMPALEAMSCGKTLVSSNSSSLPEIVSDAAICVDPYSVDEITNAMKKLLQEPETRQSLEQKALERAKMFSWEKTARETIKVYQEAVTS